ncbi:ATP-binding protein [Sphaerisporangium sp. NPDC051011]|uniref:ATP-binding protein n=1 Tax=Sphaerisporangium sp. NPDC051011 TaxID=3155792 RepID=UPI0033F12754
MPDATETQVLGAMSFPGTPAQVAHARTYTRTTLAKALGPENSAIDDVELLVSETVTNAILHTPSGRTDPTGRPIGEVTLALALTSRTVRVEVMDEGTAAVPELHPSPCDEHGRGLWLVASIASAWGHKRHESTAIVWFEVPFSSHPGDVSGSGD